MSKNSELASRLNKEEILRVLQKDGPMSRADLRRAIGISFPAITNNVNKLIHKGLVIELGEANNAMGRKATLVAFNSTRSYLIGVDVGRSNIRAICIDLSGNTLAMCEHKINIEEDVFSQVKSTIYNVIKEAQIDISEVTAIGVGIPGIYDKATGKHMLNPFSYGWSNGSLYKYLEEEFKVKIYMENSVNLGLIGEQWQGACKGYKNVAYINFGVGFGSALILNGKLVRGHNGAFGEMGYMILEQDKLIRETSDEGALEQLIPSGEINSIIKKMYKSGDTIIMSDVLDKLKNSPGGLSSEKLVNYFAMAIINLISITNPEIVIIAGRLGCALYKENDEIINKAIKINVPFAPKIYLTKLNEKANVIGAAALALKNANKQHELLRDIL